MPEPLQRIRDLGHAAFWRLLHDLGQNTPPAAPLSPVLADHLCQALGDIAFWQSRTPQLDTLRVAWIGSSTALAQDFIEAAIYAPFELFMALPEDGEPDKDILGLALHAGAKIFLTRDLPMALDEAHYVYLGAAPAAMPSAQETLRPLDATPRLTPELLALARPGALVLPGASDAPCFPVDTALPSLAPDLYARREHYWNKARGI